MVEDGPDGAMQASASDDAGTSMTVGVALHDKLVETDFNGVLVRGVAPVRLATSDPFGVVKYTEFGISLAEIPPGLAMGQALGQALYSPLLGRLTTFVQGTISSWLETDVGDLDTE